MMYNHSRKGIKSTDAEFQEYEGLAARYLKEERDHSADMVTFIQAMTKKKTPSHTIKVKVQGVREFFIKHRIALDEFEKREIKKVLPRKMHRETNFDFMTIEKIQAILPHLDIRMQTFVLCLLSSGARIGELLSANIPDLDLDAKPISLRIRETKSGGSRTVFFTQEAGDSLKKWLKSRDAYLEMAGNRSAVLKINGRVKDEKRIFPFEKPTVYRAYNRALTKAGLFEKDDKTDRNVLNVHRLRAFFKVTVNPIVGSDISELLLGHADPYENSYRSLDDKSIREQYLRCEQALTISNNVRIRYDLEKQSEEVAELKRQLDEERSRSRDFENKVMDQLSTLKTVEKEFYIAPDGTKYVRVEKEILRRLDMLKEDSPNVPPYFFYKVEDLP